ncbi:MAG: methyltransferase, TIGR04325 family [Cytophagales bacterium]|nr:methyltransferase, TIGR04325 family [Cytophagales bacterium]
MKYREYIKRWMPPIIIDTYRNIKYKKNEQNHKKLWSGNYETWDQAKAQSTGYDAQIILEKVKNSMLLVKAGKAVYERDSVLFDKIQYSWPTLAALLKVAGEYDGNLNVLDFGGSLGSTYFQNRDFFAHIKSLNWCIVEQKNFVEEGKKYLADNQLKFYYNIEESISAHKPHLLLLSGVLQCIDLPYDWISGFMQHSIPYIVVDRTAFISADNERLTVQNVPEHIYKASYPAWFFNENKFIQSFTAQYSLVADFESAFTPPYTLEDGANVYWKGFIFKLINHA